MEIRLHQLGKRYGNEWIFKGVDTTIPSGEHVAVVGPNGSGKSTLLQVIAGSQLPTAGSASWIVGGSSIAKDAVFSHLSLSAPYLEFPEELRLHELIDFHFSFKSPVNGLSATELIAISGLSKASDRFIRAFSSGMKQRVRLLLALCSNVPLVILDEPCSNLDKESVTWYQELLERFSPGRTMIIGSNHTPAEISSCTRVLDITTWKP